MRRILLVKLTIIALALFVFLPSGRSQESLVGQWEGIIDANGTPMHLVWHVTRGADGSVASTFDNVDESAFGIKVKSMNLKGSDLTLEVDDVIDANGSQVNVKGSFVGTVSQDGSEVTGTFTQTEPQPQPPMELHLKRDTAAATASAAQGAPGGAAPAAAPSAGTAAPAIAGDWKGVLMDQLHLVLHITAGKDGALAATLDSVDQNAPGIPVSSVTLKDGKLNLTVDAVHGTYDGTVSPDGNSIDGTWSQGTPLPLKFTRAGAA